MEGLQSAQLHSVRMQIHRELCILWRRKRFQRDEMKELIKEFRKQGDIIEKNIFRSVHNVNLRTIIGYHKDDMEYNFLDDYNERGK